MTETPPGIPEFGKQGQATMHYIVILVGLN